MTDTLTPSLSHRISPRLRAVLLGSAMLSLAACMSNTGWDPDLRGHGMGTADAARDAATRPAADSRGIISYPNYQVAVARQGDTVASVAQRVGVNAQDLANYNAVTPVTPLNGGQVLALPGRVSEPVATAGSMAPLDGGMTDSGTAAPVSVSNEQIDVSSLSSAIDKGAAAQPAAAPAAVPRGGVQPAASEPQRHKVTRGETAFTVARDYNVTPKALADWNGLSGDMSVHEGQILLIPPAAKATASAAPKAAPAAAAPAATSAAAVSAAPAASAAKSQLQMPVSGSIIRPYVKKKNDGIDIGAAAGTPVKAAEAGTVAAITKDTEQVPILVIRHPSGLLTVYANVDNITVAKGDSVKRGQTIAKVRSGGDNYLHFEVRKGFDSVDPVPYLE